MKYHHDNARATSIAMGASLLCNVLLGAAQNPPPVLTHLNLTPILAENGTAVLAGDISDVSTSAKLALSIHWGDSLSNENVSLPAGAASFHLTHRYLDDGQSGTPAENCAVSLTLSAGAAPSTNGFLSALFQDLLGRPFDLAQEGFYENRSAGTDSAGFTVTVTNASPVLTFVNITSPLFEGGIAALSGQFSDPGTLDTFTLQVDWGDGSPVQILALASRVRAFNVPHLFATPHTTNQVHLTLTDDDGGSATQVLSAVVNERPPRFTAIQRQPGSITRLDGLGVPARTYTVQATTNLAGPANWFNLGSITATANGTFTTFDMPPPGQARRFYRFRSP